MNAPDPNGKPEVERSGKVTILTFAAAAARDAEDVIARELGGRAAGSDGGHLLLDFVNVKRLGGVELGTLVTLHKRVRAAGGRLTLFNVTPLLHEIFRVTRLDTLLVIGTEADDGVDGRVPPTPTTAVGSPARNASPAHQQTPGRATPATRIGVPHLPVLRYAYPLSNGGSEYTFGDFVWTVVPARAGEWKITAESGADGLEIPTRVMATGFVSAAAAELALVTNRPHLYLTTGAPAP